MPAVPPLLDHLPPPYARLLARVVAAADAVPLWLVGGPVRDMLLAHPPGRDLDLAVEGDAPALAHRLAAALGGRVSAHHEAFGTATVLLSIPDEAGEPLPVTLDLASTRREHYPRPGVLPEVQPADIQTDLARRDFSINALALRLEPQAGHLHATSLLDPFAGQRDLAAGVLRVLHPRSFVDDPTRILRGLRLAARLGLHFEPHTRALLAAALDADLLAATGPDRIRAELCLALAEPQPADLLRRARELDIMRYVFAPLQQLQQIDLDALDLESALEATPDPLVRAALLTYHLSHQQRADLIQRYRLPADSARLLRDVGELRHQAATLTQATPLPNSALDRLLRPFQLPVLRAAALLLGPPASQRIAHYTSQLRHSAPHLNGHDLQRLGIAPGPRLGALLAELRAAHLDGLVRSRAEEETWVRQRADAPA